MTTCCINSVATHKRALEHPLLLHTQDRFIARFTVHIHIVQQNQTPCTVQYSYCTSLYITVHTLYIQYCTMLKGYSKPLSTTLHQRPIRPVTQPMFLKTIQKLTCFSCFLFSFYRHCFYCTLVVHVFLASAPLVLLVLLINHIPTLIPSPYNACSAWPLSLQSHFRSTRLACVAPTSNFFSSPLSVARARLAYPALAPIYLSLLSLHLNTDHPLLIN